MGWMGLGEGREWKGGRGWDWDGEGGWQASYRLGYIS